MLKFLLMLVVGGVAVFYMLSHIQSEGLVNSHCRRYATEHTQRNLEAGLRVRDREMEEDIYGTCLEDLKNASVLDVMLYNIDTKQEEE